MMKSQGTTFITRWWNRRKEKWNERRLYYEAQDDKRQQELNNVWNEWRKEEERKRKDWEQLSPMQRWQIRALNTHKKSDGDDGRFWPFGEDGFSGGG
jgi:hypothetical protein